MFSHRYRYWFILALTLYTFLNTVLCEVYFYFRIEIEWYYALTTIFLCTLLTWEGNRLISIFYKPDTKHKIRFLVLFFLSGTVVAVLAAIISVYIIGTLVHGYSWSENLNPLKLNIIYTGLVNLFFHLLHAIYFFFGEYRRQWREAEELRKQSSQAQVQLVKSQINPHFLFNNLNVLSGMVIRDNPEANRFIEEFAKVYRYVLTNQEKELVPLESELDFVQPYIFLLRKRFNEAVNVDINIPSELRRLYIIPVALQMLIENAIKHNIVSRARPLHISIYTDEHQTLIVHNNLQRRKEDTVSTLIGLENIRKRYELISGRNVIVNETAAYFEVRLPLLTTNLNNESTDRRG